MSEKHYYTEGSDGTRLFVRKWRTEQKPKAHLLLIHGFSEHSGRYEEWARKFVAQNIEVVAFDLRGHGKSGGIRGHTPGFDQLLKDIDLVLKENKPDDNQPLFLYGQSLGGGLVINYGLSRANGFDGIIATSPWLKLSTEPKAFILLLSRALKIIAPRAVRDSKLDINYLSHDPEVIRKYEADTLTHRQITPHLFFGARKAGYQAIKKAGQLQHPLLLMHGTGDKITSLRASEQFAQNAVKENKDVRFIQWDGLYHELHHEVEKDQVFDAIRSWIDDQLKNQ
jgi:alpha-beta hydrolase superfamily lysophospholipase